ncbi:MAG: LysM domain-containing protein [Algisphaera sp.]
MFPLTTVVTAASLIAVSTLGGCQRLHSVYKKDTGDMSVVAAPAEPVFVPIAMPDENVDAVPEVLEGDAPDAIDAIEPLDETMAPEPMETYVVQKNDTFSGISLKLYGTVKRTNDLIAANPEVTPKKMQIGDILNVPR